MLEILANFLLYIGAFQIALAGFMFIVLAFPDRPRMHSLLTSKKLQQSLIRDYKQRHAKVGGLLGIMILLMKSGAVCITTGAILWLALQAASHLPFF